jgi:hypothetical protein
MRPSTPAASGPRAPSAARIPGRLARACRAPRRARAGCAGGSGAGRGSAGCPGRRPRDSPSSARRAGCAINSPTSAWRRGSPPGRGRGPRASARGGARPPPWPSGPSPRGASPRGRPGRRRRSPGCAASTGQGGGCARSGTPAVPAGSPAWRRGCRSRSRPARRPARGGVAGLEAETLQVQDADRLGDGPGARGGLEAVGGSSVRVRPARRRAGRGPRPPRAARPPAGDVALGHEELRRVERRQDRQQVLDPSAPWPP